MKKIVGIVLILALCLSLFSACSGDSTTNMTGTTTTAAATKVTTGTTAATTTETTNPYAETLDITYGCTGSSGAWAQADSKTELWLENKFNVNLTPVLFDATNKDASNLIIASGEIPDIGFFYLPVSDMNNQGVIRSIPRSLIEENAPRYAAFLTDNPYGWKINKMPGKDDEYGALTGYNSSLLGCGWLNLYRLDWLEKLGIKPKGDMTEISDGIFWTTQAFTVDEFTNIAKLFTTGDPDGNGSNDTYGISCGPYLHYSWASLYGAFGLTNSSNNVEEYGKAVPYYASNAYKDFLTYVSGLYKQGYIDPEVATQDLRAGWEKFSTGICGWQTLEKDYVNPAYSDRPPYSLLTNNPDAKVLLTPPIIGADGQQSSYQYVNSAFNYTYYIGKQVDDKKLARILMMYDEMSFDEETFVVTSFGFEDESFNWEGEAYNSAALSIELSTEKKAELLCGLTTAFIPPEMLKFKISSALATLQDFSTSVEGLAMTSYPSYKADLYGTYAEELKAWNDQYTSEKDLITGSFQTNAITGADVPGTWDQYVADLTSTGGFLELVEIINQYPIVADELK